MPPTTAWGPPIPNDGLLHTCLNLQELNQGPQEGPKLYQICHTKTLYMI